MFNRRNNAFFFSTSPMGGLTVTSVTSSVSLAESGGAEGSASSSSFMGKPVVNVEEPEAGKSPPPLSLLVLDNGETLGLTDSNESIPEDRRGLTSDLDPSSKTRVSIQEEGRGAFFFLRERAIGSIKFNSFSNLCEWLILRIVPGENL